MFRRTQKRSISAVPLSIFGEDVSFRAVEYVVRAQEIARDAVNTVVVYNTVQERAQREHAVDFLTLSSGKRSAIPLLEENLLRLLSYDRHLFLAEETTQCEKTEDFEVLFLFRSEHGMWQVRLLATHSQGLRGGRSTARLEGRGPSSPMP